MSRPDRTGRLELCAILLAGAGHVGIELYAGGRAAYAYNALVAAAFLAYVLWRLVRDAGQRREWGFRLDNFSLALRAQLNFAVPAVVAVLVFGMAFGTLRIPPTFWLTLVLYPAWGIAQQFALQNLIATNLAGAIRNENALALTASLLFAVAHLPDLPPVGLTLLAGFFFTRIHRSRPNLWAVGIVHGLLGGLIFYVVLGRDPGAPILAFLGLG